MERLKKVQQFIKEHQLSALIIDHPIDLYYLIEKDISLGRLIVQEDQATLFIDGRYYESCQNLKSVSCVLTEGNEKESVFFKEWKHAGSKVGFDAEYTTYAAFIELKELQSELIPLKGPIRRLREIKDSFEIQMLKKAAHLCAEGFDYVRSILSEGISEKELARALEIFWLNKGGEKLSFNPMIAFGDGTSQPHYRVTDRKLKKGDAVLIDIGVVCNHYCSDMTRVLCFGSAPPFMEEIYKVVYDAYQVAVELCRPKVTIAQVDLAARNYIAQKGYKKNFPHGLGHGVGLEIHESPRIRSYGEDAMRTLEEGMVITIEPGVYLPGKGGVRLEDTLLITKTGYENLIGRPLPTQIPLK